MLFQWPLLVLAQTSPFCPLPLPRRPLLLCASTGLCTGRTPWTSPWALSPATAHPPRVPSPKKACCITRRAPRTWARSTGRLALWCSGKSPCSFGLRLGPEVVGLSGPQQGALCGKSLRRGRWLPPPQGLGYQLLCEASRLWDPRKPAWNALGEDLGWGCTSCPQESRGRSAPCCPSAVLASRSLPQKTGPWPPWPLGFRLQFVGRARHPGSAWPRFWARPHPCMLSPCSNGILYQYPDRTDVIPLLSVNMG